MKIKFLLQNTLFCGKPGKDSLWSLSVKSSLNRVCSIRDPKEQEIKYELKFTGHFQASNPSHNDNENLI